MQTPLAPQHHRSSEGALAYTTLSAVGAVAVGGRECGKTTAGASSAASYCSAHRTSCVSANHYLGAASINFPRLSLDTKDECCLNSTCDKNTGRSVSIFGTVWASYLFVFVALTFTLSVVFTVGYYVNLFAYTPPRNISVADHRKLFGKTFPKNESAASIIERAKMRKPS